jgi:hypothetical protein
MENKAIFTICAKNYLAQALALKSSVEATNPGLDFYIFISDRAAEDDIPGLIYPDNSWLPGWEKMAFKYNVIEYSTSIKPFCINYLFNNYGKVVYLDPDIYVTADLTPIFEELDVKDVMITPHYCEIEEHYSGAVSEEEILFVGIYNLGFLAIKNSEVGGKIVNWWMNRLANKCYADKIDALHVDQKWFDFIPAFFPDNVLITHHLGINTAIWNLHERNLIIESDKFLVENDKSGEKFPLLFFHFSGFNPKNPKLINRRHPKYNIDAFPTFRPLFRVYTDLVMKNGYERFVQIQYGFNVFNNSEKITPLHRRLFREVGESIACDNPFNSKDSFYQILNENKLLTGVKISKTESSNPNIIKTRDREINAGKAFLKFLKALMGIKYYNYLLVFFSEHHRLEKQTIIISQKTLKKYQK